MITYIGQAQGPFKAGTEVINIILHNDTNVAISNLFKIGIITVPHHKVKINNVSMEIGKTGMLEVRDTPIASIIFEQDEDLNTFVDFMAEV